MARYTNVEAALKTRESQLSRAADALSQYYHCTSEVDVVGTGDAASVEAIYNVTFPVYFVNKPKHSFGSEIANGETVTPGAFPTLSPTVIQWDQRIRDDGTPIYAGATIGVVMSGQPNQVGRVQFHVEGMAIRQVTAIAEALDELPGIQPPDIVLPGAPITASPAVDVHAVTVEFLPPTSTGGSPVITYVATATSTNGGATRSVTHASSPITITGLTPSKTYVVTVRATTAAGTGPAATAGTVTADP